MWAQEGGKNCLFGALQSSQGRSGSLHIPDKFINRIVSYLERFFVTVFKLCACSFYLHRPVKTLICTKNKKHPSCSRQKVHASAGEMTFLDSKDRVCFLLKLSIVPGAAAVVLRGEPPTAGQGSQSEGRRGRPWGRGAPALPRSHRTRKRATVANSTHVGKLLFLWANRSLQSP